MEKKRHLTKKERNKEIIQSYNKMNPDFFENADIEVSKKENFIETKIRFSLESLSEGELETITSIAIKCNMQELLSELLATDFVAKKRVAISAFPTAIKEGNIEIVKMLVKAQGQM